METPNTKEFEVLGVSRSGRVRKKSSKLLDFQSPDEVEKKVYKRTTASTPLQKATTIKYAGRGRPSLAALKARRFAQMGPDEENDVDIDENDVESQHKEDMDVDSPKETGDEDEEEEEDDDMDDGIHNTSGLTAVSDSDDDDGFGELVADLVGSEGANLDATVANQKSPFRQSLYMTEKNKKIKEPRLERKDKGKTRYTAYNMWAREHRKASKFGKTADIDHQAARRLHELWSNVSNKEKNAWKRKAKMQATRAKQREKSGINHLNKFAAGQVNQPSPNSTFINRPTTSRTKKLAEDKQKAKDELVVTKPSTSLALTTKRTRNNSYRRNYTGTLSSNNITSSLYAATNGSASNYNNTNKSLALNNTKTPLPTIEPIDAAAHLKLLGESLSIIGDRLKEHEGQIAVSGSLSVLLDSLLCSLGPLLCLTTCLPGLDKKPQLKANLATTLDNIAYVMPGL